MEDSVIAKMTLSTRFSLGFSKRFVMTERGGSVLARLSVQNALYHEYNKYRHDPLALDINICARIFAYSFFSPFFGESSSTMLLGSFQASATYLV
jgi:hypothetical protein